MPTCVASRRSPFLIALLALALATSAGGRAFAGPPYETDDPDPTQYRNYEIYFHVDYRRVDDDIESDAGTLEINYGLFPNTQFSVSLPDLEIGIKYRFIRETSTTPQVSFYPSIEGATLFLPLWAQKSLGKWTLFGGGGLLLGGSSPRSAWQDGLAITRDLSAATNVGVEIFQRRYVSARIRCVRVAARPYVASVVLSSKSSSSTSPPAQASCGHRQTSALSSQSRHSCEQRSPSFATSHVQAWHSQIGMMRYLGSSLE